ncbi:MAG: hypothetical protein VXA43_05810 [Candidatus Poseidoniales archaeon]
MEAFWISAEFGPTSVLLGNEFVTDFMKQKRRTDGNEHHRHGEEEHGDPAREAIDANAPNAANSHETKGEGERSHGQAEVLFFHVTEMPKSTGVMFRFFPRVLTQKLHQGV